MCRRNLLLIGLLAVATTNVGRAAEAAIPAQTLAEARAGFHTTLVRQTRIGEAAETPPPSSGLELVRYPTALGEMEAYVGPLPQDGKKHPVIIWLVGGFSNSISRTAWTPRPAENDQSASGFREAGIVMMYPSLRGGNANPGFMETFLGEADDVLAAAEYLKRQGYVDTERIYLGGHSTGGTLALIVAELPNPFRAIICLGPVENVSGYGEDVLPYDLLSLKETRVRSPLYWLRDVKTKTWVLEGASGRGNIDSLRTLQRAAQNPLITFVAVPGRDHFSLIRPVVTALTKKIAADTDAVCGIELTAAELR